MPHGCQGWKAGDLRGSFSDGHGSRIERLVGTAVARKRALHRSVAGRLGSSDLLEASSRRRRPIASIHYWWINASDVGVCKNVSAVKHFALLALVLIGVVAGGAVMLLISGPSPFALAGAAYGGTTACLWAIFHRLIYGRG